MREHACDFGVAFDGDADRMFLVDEKGALIGGDIVTALVGLDTLRVSPAAKSLQPHLQPQRARTIEKPAAFRCVRKSGTRSSKKSMRDEDIPFGGEHSGHFYFSATGLPIPDDRADAMP